MGTLPVGYLCSFFEDFERGRAKLPMREPLFLGEGIQDFDVRIPCGKNDGVLWSIQSNLRPISNNGFMQFVNIAFGFYLTSFVVKT